MAYLPPICHLFADSSYLGVPHFLFGVANESHTLKTGTERIFFALLRVTILNKELDIFKAEEKKVLHAFKA